MPRSRSIWKDGKLYAEYEGDKLVFLSTEYQTPKRSDTVKSPYFMKDIGEYRSPLDGQMITTRSQHRDHVRAHDVIEVGNEHVKQAPAPPSVDRELGELVKRRVEEVRAMPQDHYDEHIAKQRYEHEQVAELVTGDDMSGFDTSAVTP